MHLLYEEHTKKKTDSEKYLDFLSGHFNKNILLRG